MIEGIKRGTVVNKTLHALEHLLEGANLLSLLRASAGPETDGYIAKRHCRLLACPLELRTTVSRILLPDVPSCLTRVLRFVRQTALVLEIDSERDVSFKDQLAAGARYISGTTITRQSSYGVDRNLLRLGHCSAQQHPSDGRRLVIQNDGTVPPKAHRANFNVVPILISLGYKNSTGIVFRVNDVVYLCSYALVPWRPEGPEVAQQCEEGQTNRRRNRISKQRRLELEVHHEFSQMVGSHKVAGRASRRSDM